MANNRKGTGGNQKRSPEKREADLLRLLDLDAKGWHAAEIARELNVSQRTIDADRADLRKRYRALVEAENVEEKGRLISILQLDAREAWRAWERSQKPRERTKGKKVEPGAGSKTRGRTEAERVREGRDGNPRFLAEVRACVLAEARLRGMLLNKLDLTSGGKPFKAYAGFDVDEV